MAMCIVLVSRSVNDIRAPLSPSSGGLQEVGFREGRLRQVERLSEEDGVARWVVARTAERVYSCGEGGCADKKTERWKQRW